MHLREANTATLLEAQDLRIIANFRGPTAAAKREPIAPPRGAPHDFLVLCPRPDLVVKIAGLEFESRS